MKEEERLRNEEKQREKQSPVHQILPQPVDVSDAVLTERAKTGKFSDLAFELYKETAIVLVVCVNCYTGVKEQDEFILPRNQAICAGQLVRIIKFMRSVLAMLSHGDELGEVVIALYRCMAESAINLRYLVLKDDPDLFDQFVKLSLSPERELYDVIQENIRERDGNILPIETRMLASINRLCKLSGVRIEEVDRKFAEWGGGIRNRLKALDIEQAYAIVQRIPSHAIHGTWVDLVLHCFEEKTGGFGLKLEGTSVDSRLLIPISIFVLDAARD